MTDRRLTFAVATFIVICVLVVAFTTDWAVAYDGLKQPITAMTRGELYWLAFLCALFARK